MITRRDLLAAGIALAGIRFQSIRFAVAPDVPAALQEGVRFGLSEASRATMLLGRSLEIAGDADIVIRAGAMIETPDGRFALSATGQDLAAAVHSAVAAGVSASPALQGVHWHHSLYKYGASELNERFVRSRGGKMSQDHWLGWLAVKIIAEAALRTDAGGSMATAIARSRFDGHKGVALRFAPDTRRLRQPLYVVDPRLDRVVWPA